jgi:hypothetical protein
VSGEVTISGQFDHRGQPEISPKITGDAPEVLRLATIEQLKSWRLEPGTGSTPFQVTFVYMIDDSLPVGAGDVGFDLPKGVTMRTGPVK